MGLAGLGIFTPNSVRMQIESARQENARKAAAYRMFLLRSAGIRSTKTNIVIIVIKNAIFSMGPAPL